ncbi:CEQ_1a_G0047290.mRNA.1.CDS.1 [Saccharomyces cerevisiae]|nr:CEQ_1a_G0046990.mRNA.1.CDS.1 [Saccharomyces cerevisiae]CAI4702002.1 CEQ_1a_G0047090.mRNA.1.CDS.1 [Saccharomyces cerevisiae]CAI4704272.1 CEQ_1a_G0047290.mRNA.1.CDS.1 [Saccharomyces cerevisiae]CAI7432323.1 CEQ_1a_G0046990.mRNA.1.CDS.1 [Saccharomyces cerevisiae]CAI7432683.1 CEQ_1a_G0047090.mRNA.1.CDS.1 [Saccharomyces cerevisiae]
MNGSRRVDLLRLIQSVTGFSGDLQKVTMRKVIQFLPTIGDLSLVDLLGDMTKKLVNSFCMCLLLANLISIGKMKSAVKPFMTPQWAIGYVTTLMAFVLT